MKAKYQSAGSDKGQEIFGVLVHRHIIPEKYMDFVILLTCRAPFLGLETGNLEQGFTAARAGVDILETLVRARNEVPENELKTAIAEVMKNNPVDGEKSWEVTKVRMEILIRAIIEGNPHEEEFLADSADELPKRVKEVVGVAITQEEPDVVKIENDT